MIPPRKNPKAKVSPPPVNNLASGNSSPFIANIDPADIQSKVSQLLKFSTFEPEQRYWLDTGYPDLNAVLGSRDLGLPYGKIYELSGLEHGGKTTICTILGGIAQRDGAAVGYIDLEDSRDESWATKLSMDWSKVVQVYPRLIYDKKEKDSKKDKPPRLQYAEELFEQAEKSMELIFRQGVQKQFWIIDSVANIQTQKIVDAGLTGQSMNTRVDRAVFLKLLLPRWSGLAANYGASICLINQLHMRPGVMFGDPYDTDGGRAIKTNCSIRARVRRLKNGRLLQNGKVVGIIGIIKNNKNKAGGGSVQDCDCGFSVVWNKTPAKVEFMSASEAEKKIKGE